MPSPVGHLVAGAAVGWIAEALPPLRGRLAHRRGSAHPLPALTPLVAGCAALALAPDFDILFGIHRTYTHSIAAVGFVALAGGIIARTRRAPALATGLALGVAVASHIVLDWLGHDSSKPAGLTALWPLSAAYLYSGIDLFAQVSRRYWKPDEFIVNNAIAVARELVILVPAAALAFWLRQRRWRRQQSDATARVGHRPGTPESRTPSPEPRL